MLPVQVTLYKYTACSHTNNAACMCANKQDKTMTLHVSHDRRPSNDACQRGCTKSNCRHNFDRSLQQRMRGGDDASCSSQHHLPAACGNSATRAWPRATGSFMCGDTFVSALLTCEPHSWLCQTESDAVAIKCKVHVSDPHKFITLQMAFRSLQRIKPFCMQSRTMTHDVKHWMYRLNADAINCSIFQPRAMIVWSPKSAYIWLHMQS